MNSDSQEENLVVQRCSSYQTLVTVWDSGKLDDLDIAAIMAHLNVANGSTATATTVPIVTINS